MKNILEQSSEVEHLIRNLPKGVVEKTIAVAVMNSMAQNFFYRFADYDLLALLKDQDEFVPLSGKWITTSIDGRRAEILFLTREHLVLLLDIASTKSVLEMTDDQASLITRICNSAALTNHCLWDEIFFLFNERAYRSKVMDRMLELCSEAFDDILGSHLKESGDIVLDFANQFFCQSVEVLLVAKGDTYCRPKWRLVRAKRALKNYPDCLSIYQEISLPGWNGKFPEQEGQLSKTLRIAKRLQIIALGSFGDCGHLYEEDYFRCDRSSRLTLHNWVCPAFHEADWYVKTLTGPKKADIKTTSILIAAMGSVNVEKTFELARSISSMLFQSTLDRSTFDNRVSSLLKANYLIQLDASS